MNQDIYLVTKKNFVSLVRQSDMYTPGPLPSIPSLFCHDTLEPPKIEALFRVMCVFSI